MRGAECVANQACPPIAKQHRRRRESAQEPTLAPGNSPGPHSGLLPAEQSCLAPIVEIRRGSKVGPRKLIDARHNEYCVRSYDNPANPLGLCLHGSLPGVFERRRAPGPAHGGTSGGWERTCFGAPGGCCVGEAEGGVPPFMVWTPRSTASC